MVSILFTSAQTAKCTDKRCNSVSSQTINSLLIARSIAILKAKSTLVIILTLGQLKVSRMVITAQKLIYLWDLPPKSIWSCMVTMELI